MLEPLERLTRAAWTRSARIMVSVSFGGFLLATEKRATVGLIDIIFAQLNIPPPLEIYLHIDKAILLSCMYLILLDRATSFQKWIIQRAESRKR